MVTDPRNGYSQSPRWGGDHPDGVKHLEIDGREYEYALGSYDCSSSTATAWRQALRHTRFEGALGTGEHDGATCTSDFNEAFAATGLFRLSMSPARRGDLYNSPGHHVAMCQDGGGDGVYGHDCLSEFNRNEHHGATGGQPGDQDGGESVMRAYYSYPWTTVIHYTGGLLECTDDTGSDDPRDGGEGKGDAMGMAPVFVRFDGDATVHLFNPWAGTLRAISCADEKAALTKMYALAGVRVDQTEHELGTRDAPWGARANDALSRGAHFAGFERFQKHPSVRAIVREEVGKVAVDGDALAEAVCDRLTEVIG